MSRTYTLERLERSRRESEREAGRRGARRALRDGELTHRIHPDGYWNAVASNGGVSESGETVWDDPGFVRDMEKRYPQIKVESQTGRTCLMVNRTALAPRARAGVTFHKRYG